MKDNSGNNDLLIERVVRIAGALDGKTEQESEHTGDRLRDALGRIATQVEQGGGSLPPVTSFDNFKVLKADIGEPGDVSWRPNTPAGKSLPFTYDGTGNTIFYHGSNLPTDDDLHVMYNEGGFTLELIAQGTYDDIVSCFARLVSYPSGVSDTWYFATGMIDFGSMGTACALVEIDNTSKSVNGRFFFPANQMNRFVVTLTPTNMDYSGTMDKTVAQINEAYEAGKEIWFKVAASGYDILIPMSNCSASSSYTYPSFDCRMVDINTDVEVCVRTGVTDDGTKTTYSTKVYAITPAS